MVKNRNKKSELFNIDVRKFFQQCLSFVTNKKNIKIIAVIAGIALIIFIMMSSCKPRTGSMLYAVCKVFLEQHVTFPSHLNYVSIEQYPKAVRIYYADIDTFGDYQQNMIECVFRSDPVLGAQVSEIIFDQYFEITEEQKIKKDVHLYRVKQEHIDKFNLSLRAIIESDPDLTLPKMQYNKLKNIR